MNISGNINNRIGALELSDAVAAMNDGTLETAAGTLYAGASMEGPCGLTSPQLCRRRIDDGALEGTAGTLYAGPTVDSMGCPGGPGLTKSIFQCRRIDDGTLENAAGAVYAGSTKEPAICSPPTWRMSGCSRIDDAALEEAAGYVYAGPSSSNPCTAFTSPQMCRRIDDSALEDAAGTFYAGATNSPGGCIPPTHHPIFCGRHVDDGALEASGERAVHPPTAWRNPMGQCV